MGGACSMVEEEYAYAYYGEEFLELSEHLL
jgi:hypothetical protein